MGYTIFYECSADTESRLFTPTGPLFTWFCQNSLPFAVATYTARV